MDYEKEIPFGAFDSELMRQEINIPEGFEANIKGDKIILKKIESDDEKTRIEIVGYLKRNLRFEWAAWLEKQGEQKPAWSEEDEEHYKACLQYFDEVNPDMVYYKDYQWLKSLKQRIGG